MNKDKNCALCKIDGGNEHLVHIRGDPLTSREILIAHSSYARGFDDGQKK